MERGPRARVRVTDLDRHVDRLLWHFTADPVHAIDLEFVANQIFRAADNHAAGDGIDIDHIAWLCGAAGQTFALPNREHLNAAVRSEKIAAEIVDAALVKFALAE